LPIDIPAYFIIIIKYHERPMANSYSTHQHAWQRGSHSYGAHLDQEYTVPSLNGHDNAKGYSPSNSSNTSLNNGTTYHQSPPSHVSSYGSNQPVQRSGAFTFGPYNAPSAPNEVTYDGFSSQQPLPDHGYGDPLNNSSYPAGGSHDDSAQVSNVHYISPIVPQHNLEPSYPYAAEAFQLHQTDEIGSQSKRPRHTYYHDASDEQEVEHPENKEGSRPKCEFL
jgi:hypothetical protein